MEFDYVLVGGGLQNALLSLALLAHKPAAKIALVESAATLGGNHLWAFHEHDVPAAARGWIEPLIAHRWAGYRVAFPGTERRFDAPYSAVSSERLHDVVSNALEGSRGSRLLLSATARSVLSNEVFLEDGRILRGALVVDARGPTASLVAAPVGYQKFLGLELSLRRPMSERLPTLMQADVPQTDGFRFFYVLPLAPDRVLVEDTYYSDTPLLDVDRLRKGILQHARAMGLDPIATVREERGVLPLPLHAMPAPSRGGPLIAGYQGGFFHPTTGYSFPLAVRLATHVATCEPDEVFGARWETLASKHERQARFCMLLNRLLFGAIAPEQRWTVFERFYRLPTSTIGRFYAMTTHAGDRARIVCGRPPRGMSLRSAFARMVA